MKELKCPTCGTTFQVDDNDYAAILAQVRNSEFQDEIERRLAEIEKQFQARQMANDAESKRMTGQQLAEKDAENAKLCQEIERLKGEISKYDAQKAAETTALEAAKERELTELKAAKERELSEVKLSKERELTELKAAKDLEIASLKAKIDTERQKRDIDVLKAVEESKDKISAKDLQISQLTSQLQAQFNAAETRERDLRDQHAIILKAKDEEIQHYKDLKSRLSTKMLGETLEQHCRNMFNRARSQGMFPSAYFEKDNDASMGSKGDFIFRDYIGDDEYISIMFEMKNEDERTATKHRNEDFFAKLDKDRTTKGCEYAILVSTLEADNELYNEGIVDVSYRYPKMLVIRPQFFMSVIVMLSQTARRGAERLIGLKLELETARAQSIDVTNFEKRRDAFVESFGKLVDAHRKKHEDAIAGIDKVIETLQKQIEQLQKVKSSFDGSAQKLFKANESAETDFSIKKLTRGNPTMKALFEEARKQDSEKSQE